MEPAVIPQDFPEPEATENYIIPTLGLHHGTFVFSYLSTFLAYITPYDLPVELLRDAFHTKVSFLHLILEALKVESGYICLIAIFFLISLVPLCYAIAWGCAKQSDDDINPGPTVDAILQAEELSLEESLRCRKGFLGLVLQVIILLLIASVIAMFMTNEQIASAIDQTPMVVRSSLVDASTFLRDAEKQINFVIFEGLNTAVERIRQDLEEIDKLLGAPIQHHLALFTGIDIIFESIIDIGTSSNNLSRRIHMLQDTLSRAAKISYEAEYRLDELQIQLSVLQRQCTFRDRPLCDTLRIKNFEETGLIERIRKLQTDPVLEKLMSMGEVGRNSSMQALTQELTIARSTFRNFAFDVKNMTDEQIDRVDDHLDELSNMTLLTTGELRTTVDLLVGKVNKAANFSDSFFDYYREVGGVLWLTGVIATITTLLVTFILLGALSCGCCHADNKAGVTLIVGAIAICIASVALSGFAMIEMLLGAHGQVFICHPLHDDPNYVILGKLIDKPGLIYPAEPQYGIIDELLKNAGSSSRQPIQVSLAAALNQCEQGRGSFGTFELQHLINVSVLFGQEDHPTLDRTFDMIGASERSFVGFTLKIQTLLDGMLYDSDLNLTSCRTELTQLSPDKDVATFIDQLQRVSAQIQDVATSSRMTTLGSRAKRLQLSLLQPLEQLRGDIVYHLTALELQISPWAAQVNKSLIHLRNAQNFLDAEAASVCHNKSELFRQRLRSHLDAYRNHTATVLSDRCASCRPLFDIFDAMRMLFCHHIMDPMNGLWFSAFICLFLWSIATPISLMLSTTYRRLELLSSKLQHSNSHRYNPRESTREDQRESSHWSTQRSVSVRINAAAESCTDDDFIATGETGDDDDDGGVVIEYIELRYTDGDPTEYRECLI